MYSLKLPVQPALIIGGWPRSRSPQIWVPQVSPLRPGRNVPLPHALKSERTM
jgi:hypothetical protein